MRTVLSVSLVVAACSATSNLSGGASGDAGTSTHCASSNECPTGWRCNDFGMCEQPPPTGDAGVAETPLALGEPISSARFVYVPMTAEDEVARIDGETLAVTTTAVGRTPSVAATIPNGDGVVVLSAIDGTATIVHPGANGGADTVSVVATLSSVNHIDVDPSGRFAVIWFDLAKYVATGGFGGIGSLQAVTVVALAAGAERAVNLAVGFHPRGVQFDAAGNRAYVITQDGVSVIDLGAVTTQGPRAVPPIAVADPSAPPDDVAVDIVATGEYAAVRQLDVAALRVVAVGATTPGQVWTIPLASPASAIALAPDGSRVYVVERAAQKLAIVDIPADAIDPTGVVTIDLSDATLGSIALSHDGTRALLYTNATLDPRLTMVALDRAGFPHVTWPLKKAVRVAGIAPTTDSAIVVHAKVPGDPSTATTLDDFIAESYGYSLVDLSTGFATLQLTPVDPGPLAYAGDGTKAYVALDGGDAPTATRALQIVDARTGIVTTDALGSPPSAVGFLPAANAAFVAQRHPLGRISFVDVVSDAVRTVTGFDLNSHVVN